MIVRTLIRKITFMSVLLILLFSCSRSKNVDPIDSTIDPEVIRPSNLTFSVDTNGSSTNEPNGDGSGVIIISASATDAISYSFRPGNGSEVNNESGVFEHTYTETGLHNYKVEVLAYSETGHSTKTSKTITIEVSDSATTNLIWADEFDTNGSPDSAKWNYNIGTGCPTICGWGNGEKEYYTDRPDNVSIENGILKITVKKEDYEGSQYTSTRMKTEGLFDFKYGKVAVRAKLPEGGGTWPAIWMLGANLRTVGWPECGEIDIMEHRGNKLGVASSAIHTASSHGNTINKGTRQISNIATEFHIYTVNWTAEKIEFAIDDVVHYTYSPTTKNSSTWPFDANQFIILNVAMGGAFGGAIDPNFVESTMEIDYVRVYQ